MYNWFAQKRSTGFLVKNVSDTSKRPKFSLRACKCPSGGTCSRRKLANSPAAQEVILIRYDLRGGFTSTKCECSKGANTPKEAQKNAWHNAE